MVLGYTGSHYQSLLPVNLPVSVSLPISQQSISSIPATEDFRVPNTSKKSAIDLKREKANERQRKLRAMKKAADPDKFREKQNKEKRESRAREKSADLEKFRENHN